MPEYVFGGGKRGPWKPNMPIGTALSKERADYLNRYAAMAGLPQGQSSQLYPTEGTTVLPTEGSEVMPTEGSEVLPTEGYTPGMVGISPIGQEMRRRGLAPSSYNRGRSSLALSSGSPWWLQRVASAGGSIPGPLSISGPNTGQVGVLTPQGYTTQEQLLRAQAMLGPTY